MSNTHLIGLSACLVGVALAHADQSDVEFNANIGNECIIAITQEGTLDPGGNFTSLTSRVGPGRPGRAEIVATGPGFTLSVEAPSGFDLEPLEDRLSDEDFTAWHGSQGATQYPETRLPETINPGLNDVRIHMDARKFGNDIFATGDYLATVILRCE